MGIKFLTVTYFILFNSYTANQKPNFLVILTDDQGHDDLGYYNHYIRTPNMDQFAKNSVEFDNFYVSPLCAPTRAALLTGRDYMSSGVWGVHGGMEFINLDETLISEVLLQNGYATAHFGKWHSGKTDGYYPWDRGFQTSYTAELYNFFNSTMLLNGNPINAPGWSEDYLADRIIDYLRRIKQPFFIYWAPMLIHTGGTEDGDEKGWVYPLEFQDYYKTVPGLSPDLISVFGAIEYLDYVFGRVIKGLQQSGKFDNTVVMLMSDNGPLLGVTDHNHPPLRDIRVPSGMLGSKGSVYENGIRSFLFVQHGKDRFVRKRIDSNTDIVDIFPTVLELSRITFASQKPVLGQSLVPLLTTGFWDYDDRVLFIHEVQKTGLKTDQILDLDASYETDKSQTLLQPSTIGPNAQPISRYMAIKQGTLKFTKNQLFNFNPNRVENDTNRVLDNKLVRVFKREASEWWQGILKEEGSFRKPIFFVGYKGRSESTVLPYAPILRTENNVVVAKRAVSGFVNVGDSLTCRLQVDTPGKYEISIKHRWVANVGASIRIEIGTQESIISNPKGKVASVTGVVSKNFVAVLGTIDLEKTPPSEKWAMKLTLVRLKASGPVFNSLQEIYLSRV